MRILRILRNLMQKITCRIVSDAMNKVKRATSVVFFVKNLCISKKSSNFAAYSLYALAWDYIFCIAHVGEMSNKCGGIRTL